MFLYYYIIFHGIAKQGIGNRSSCEDSIYSIYVLLICVVNTTKRILVTFSNNLKTSKDYNDTTKFKSRTLTGSRLWGWCPWVGQGSRPLACRILTRVCSPWPCQGLKRVGSELLLGRVQHRFLDVTIHALKCTLAAWKQRKNIVKNIVYYLL